MTKSIHRSASLVLIWILLIACTGPKPSIQSSELKLVNAETSLYSVNVVVTNDSRGSGQIEVHAALQNPETGVKYKESKKLSLEPHETAAMVLFITAPIANYRPEVEVEYPIK